VDSALLVRRAAQCFEGGDHASFYACLADDVCVYPEPAVASGAAFLTSRTELAAWLERGLAAHPGLDISISAVEPCGQGVLCDAVVVSADGPGEVWRLSFAVLAEDRLIRELRAFWGREAARAWLVKSG
jgi:hypothetical protein